MELYIGTPPQHIVAALSLSDEPLMIMNTSAASLTHPDWCEDAFHHCYDSSRSSSHQGSDTHVEGKYDLIHFAGTRSAEVVCWAGLSVEANFLEATSQSLGGIQGEEFDTILSFPLPGKSRKNDVTNANLTSPWKTIMSEKLLNRNIVAFEFGSGDSTSKSGEVTFGNIHPWYAWLLASFPVNEPLADDSSLRLSTNWHVEAQSVDVGEKSFDLANYTAEFSISDTYMILPKSVIDSILKGVQVGVGGIAPQVNCSARATLPNLNFSLGPNDGSHGSVDLIVTPWDYIMEVDSPAPQGLERLCLAPFISQQDAWGREQPLIHLGTSFLKAFYSVFDFDNRGILRKYTPFHRPERAAANQGFSCPQATGRLRLTWMKVYE